MGEEGGFWGVGILGESHPKFSNCSFPTWLRGKYIQVMSVRKISSKTSLGNLKSLQINSIRCKKWIA
jgi:hypothetical protein